MKKLFTIKTHPPGEEIIIGALVNDDDDRMEMIILNKSHSNKKCIDKGAVYYKNVPRVSYDHL